MSRKTTARRGAAAVVATAVLAPGFALGIAQAAPTDAAVTGLSTGVVAKSATPGVLTITGKNFTGADRVRLDNGSAPIDIAEQSFFVLSSTKIIVPLPSLTSAAAGVYNVLVTGANGVVSANTVRDNLKVTEAAAVTSLSADAVSAAGGGKLQVRGTNLLGAKKVTIGAYEARITKVTDTAVDIVAPAMPVGADYELRVTTPAGEAPGIVGDEVDVKAFVNKAVPSVVDPAGGTVVTVSGAGLLAAATSGDVKLLLKNATGALLAQYDVAADDFEALSQTELVVRVPAADAAGWSAANQVFAGTFVEVVVEDNNTLTGYRPVKVQYAPVPAGSISAADSVHTLDTTPSTREWHNVTITGRNLSGGIVRVNGIQVPTVSNNGTTLVFKTVRQGTEVGPWNVTVTTSKGSKTVGTLTYTNDVAVTTTRSVVKPAGEELSLTGTGFKALPSTGAVTMQVGSDPATTLTYTVVDNTRLLVNVPTRAAGTLATLTVTPPTTHGVADTVALTFGTALSSTTARTLQVAGAAVTLTGYGFGALPTSGAVSYTVGSAAPVAISGYTTNAEGTELTFTVPAAAQGSTGRVTVTPATGYGSAQSFDTTWGVAISDTAVNVPAAGGSVAFNGVGFNTLTGTGEVAVTINSLAVTVTYVRTSDTVLTVTFPAQTATHTGTLVLTPPAGYGSADTVNLTVV